MALLDGYFGMGGTPNTAFPNVAAPGEDPERAAVDAAAEAAARRVKRSNIRRNEGFPGADISGAGMLAGAPSYTGGASPWGKVDEAAAAGGLPALPTVSVGGPGGGDGGSGAEPNEVWTGGDGGSGGEPSAAAKPMTTPRPVAGPQVASAAPAQPGFGTRLSSLLGRNSNMLMAMGAGMMGAPSLAQGMSRGFAAAIPASAQDTKQALQQSSIQESYKALIAAGASPADALAAVYNPEVMKALTPRIFGKAMDWKVVKEYPDGTKEYGFVDGANASVTRGSEVTKPRVRTMEEALHLPKGTHFIDPDGIVRVR